MRRLGEQRAPYPEPMRLTSDVERQRRHGHRAIVHVGDGHGSVAPLRHLRLSGDVSNLFDRQNFTKRSQFYPGPGVWPSDRRFMFVSLVSLVVR